MEYNKKEHFALCVDIYAKNNNVDKSEYEILSSGKMIGFISWNSDVPKPSNPELRDIFNENIDMFVNLKHISKLNELDSDFSRVEEDVAILMKRTLTSEQQAIVDEKVALRGVIRGNKVQS